MQSDVASVCLLSALPLPGGWLPWATLMRDREGTCRCQGDSMVLRVGNRSLEAALGLGGEGVSMGTWHSRMGRWHGTQRPRPPQGSPRYGALGCGMGGQAAFQGTSRRLSPSGELGEGDVQRAGPALLAEQAGGYLAQSPEAVFLFGSIRLQSKHWQIGIPTWALTNPNRLGHSFQLICLGQKCSACPGLVVESRTLLTVPPAL